MSDPGTFGSRLRSLRDRAGYTQTEFAELAGITEQSLIRYEKDRRVPGWDLVVRFAEILDVTPNDFLPPPADEPADEPPPRAMGKRK